MNRTNTGELVSTSLGKLTMQPCLGDGPPALDSRFGYAESLRGFPNIKTAEEPKLDDPCQLRILFFQSLESFIQIDQIKIDIIRGERERGVEAEIGLDSASPDPMFRSRVIDENTAHQR